jgi:hypothetical protein
MQNLGIIVCADDFGMSPGVNSAIIKLLENKRISAVSCLVNGDAWDEGADLLKRFSDVDIGLHLSFRKLNFNKIMELAYLRKIGKEIILDDFKAQLECFHKGLGRFPDFIDSHQYIHQLPVFRLAFMELIDSLNTQRIYIRNSSMPLINIFRRNISIFKNIFISIPGAIFKRRLLEKHLYTNNDFFGVYNFKSKGKFQKIFTSFIKTVYTQNSIFVVHPGYKTKPCNCRGRCFECRQEEEMEYLNSQLYKDDLRYHNLCLARFIY